jgi:hypothetical protein
MERITDGDIDEVEEDLENIENLRNNYSIDELSSMCASFARENMKLIRWLYKYHLQILRDYETKYMGGKHIYFGD